MNIPYLGGTLRFITDFVDRFYKDRILVESSHLAYVTLLSLVPFITVLFSMFSILPVFQSTKAQLKEMIFSNFMPVFGDVIEQNFEIFTENASNTSIIGALFLLITALMLIESINSSVNHIWKCTGNRSWVTKLPVYWMVLTLGPILIGVSLALTSIAVSYKIDEGLGIVPFLQRNIIRFMPILFSFVALLLMYVVVPVRKVKISYAVLGAIVSAILLEVGKRGFSLYIIHFPSYQNIYGAIGIIPILLLWLYISWVIVFIGVEVQSTLQCKYDGKVGNSIVKENLEECDCEDVQDESKDSITDDNLKVEATTEPSNTTPPEGDNK